MSIHSGRRLASVGAKSCACGLFCCGVALGQVDPPEATAPSRPESTVKVTGRGTVEMHVSEMPLDKVLQLLSLQSRRNIIASPAVVGSVTASLFDVSFEEALQAVLVANGAGYRREGSFIYVYTNEELAALKAKEDPSGTRVFPLNYISGADAAKYVASLVGEGGSVTPSAEPEKGIGSSPEEGGGDSGAGRDFIIVTTSPENMTRIEAVLRAVDVRPKQVLIEATILRAQLNDDNALGVDFSLVGGVDFQLLGASSTGIANLTLGQLPQDRFERFNTAVSTDFRSDVPTGGLTFGVIKDQVAVFIRALESVTNTTVLANPKILALNKQRGQVIVGRRDGFLTTTVTEVQAIQSVEFLETGTQLIFRPFIGDDGYVRVELHPEDSVGFVNAQGLPSEQTTEVTTNVYIKDGHTILIGGLFREVSTDKRSLVPGLGNLPGIGQLFRSNSDSTVREEVIILLTVTIIKDDERYAAASLEQWQNIERMRVGVRRGMMWHGRERLAQSHYRRALKWLAEGDTNKAMWNVNLSLHSNGQFLPAIKLKEKIVGRREWAEDAASARLFLYRLIAEERGDPADPFGRPTFSSGDSGDKQHEEPDGNDP